MMLLFKRNTSLIFIAAIVAFGAAGYGCSKNNSVSTQKSFMRFKSDGTLKEFADCNVVFLDTMVGISPTVYYCHITSGIHTDWSALSVYTTDPLAAGHTFTQVLNAVTSAPVGGIATKNDTEGEYISWQGGWPYYDVSITLTEVSAKYIKGKFSGQVRELTGNTIHTITEGEFQADMP